MTALADFPISLGSLAEMKNRGRTIIYETVYGSKFYGCDMPGSDHDIRGVYMPGLWDFLQERKETPAKLVPDADLGESDDIEYYPAGLFVDQLMRAKSNAVEIFFGAMCDRERGTQIHPVMNMILDEKDNIILADPAGFIGHARQRASAYIAGDDPNDRTLQANKHVLALLKEAAVASLEAPAKRIMDIPGLCDALENHGSVTRDKSKSGEDVLFIHHRQMPVNTQIALAIETIQTRLKRFQEKDLDASPKVMFKHLYTSLRMMETAETLMTTGSISYPLPRAEYYRAIRREEIAPDEIIEQITATQLRVEKFVKEGHSPLRPKYDADAHVAVRNELVARIRYHALQSLTL